MLILINQSINQHINSLLSTLNNVQCYAFMGKFEFYTNFKVDNWVNIYKLYKKSQNIARKKKKTYRYRIIYDNRSFCNAIIDTTSAILTMQLNKNLNGDICISPRFNFFKFSDIFHIKSIEGIHFWSLYYREKHIIYYLEATSTIWESRHFLS